MKLISNVSQEKLRGGFYTPEPIANFILKWGINGRADCDILEPSCGDGVFLEQLKKRKAPYRSLKAIEIEMEEARKASLIQLNNKEIIVGDFHQFCNNTDLRFDLVVGNPPFIRYQYFDEAQQSEAEKLFARSNLKFTRLTNAWVSFVVGATQLLKEQGKIGFVLPAEILQVSYAQQLRNFLAQQYDKINIISFEKLVFPVIQQEVVLLLCEKNGNGTHLIEHLELKDSDDLENIDITLLKSPTKQIDFKSNKWTFYFLNQEEINFLENVATNKNIPAIGDFANVEVGITTGSNNFFTVPKSVVEMFNLQDYAKPMVGRSVQVNGPIFTLEDWKQNSAVQAKAHLLVFPERTKLQKNKDAMNYIRQGEKKGINKGYKCHIRDDWFVVPSIKVSDALFIRRNGLHPRLIVNEAKAYTTDTMHRVFTKENVNMNAFVASFYNSLSFAFSEISGRSYGGGVLELMPSEVEKILLPYQNNNAGILQIVSRMVRANTNIDEILRVTNQKILAEGFGFTQHEIDLSTNIWRKLSNRRINRGKWR
ncbi:MAG: class I SAM-dependent methyltransferase [Tannerellaceae bacterium]|jgi:adenine-specific DNA methylase|nr:class I SAM-dependent methyltransferase [Tannerellaceae bacterium]